MTSTRIVGFREVAGHTKYEVETRQGEGAPVTVLLRYSDVLNYHKARGALRHGGASARGARKGGEGQMPCEVRRGYSPGNLARSRPPPARGRHARRRPRGWRPVAAQRGDTWARQRPRPGRD